MCQESEQKVCCEESLPRRDYQKDTAAPVLLKCRTRLENVCILSENTKQTSGR